MPANLKFKGALVSHFGSVAGAAAPLGTTASRLSLIIHRHARASEPERHAIAETFGRKLLRTLDDEEAVDPGELQELRELAKVFKSAARLRPRERAEVAANFGISSDTLERRAKGLRGRGVVALYRKRRSDRGLTRFFSPELQTFAIVVFFKRAEASYEDVWRAVRVLALTLGQTAPGYSTVRHWVRGAFARKGLVERKKKRRRQKRNLMTLKDAKSALHRWPPISNSSR
ncbi:MAG: hypothetical protein HYV04_07380 [Deltaproteobacteria bacterium]|nr:hypothetical protein [Deltaproteobacteria bacterium]